MTFWYGLILCVVAGPLLASPVCVNDDSNAKVCLEDKPMRIATLSPHATELVAAIVEADRIVAVSDFSDYPESMSAKPVIANHAGISLEALVNYQLDLIVAWSDGVSVEQKKRINQLGIPVYYSNPTTMDGIKENIDELGVLTHEHAQAALALQQIERTLNTIDAPNDEVKPSALFLISQQPLMALSNQGIAGEALKLCGINNIFADSLTPAPLVNMEAVINSPPDIVILTTGSPVPSNMLSLIEAAGDKRPALVYVEADLLFRASPRFVDGIHHLCEQVGDK